MSRTRTLINRGTAGVAGLALAGGGALAAAPGAGASSAVPTDSTAQCQINTNCFEPVFAVAQQGGQTANFTQADDAALTVQGPVATGTPVFSRIRNSLDDGTQDFSFDVIGHVPFFGAGDYGFTSFDRSHWAGKPIIQVEATPFGQDTGLCVNFGRVTHRAALQPCGTGGGQAFILSHFVVGANSPASSAYNFAISVRQANVLNRHQVVTGQPDGFGQVSVANVINHSPGAATDQMLSALP